MGPGARCLRRPCGRPSAGSWPRRSWLGRGGLAFVVASHSSAPRQPAEGPFHHGEPPPAPPCRTVRGATAPAAYCPARRRRRVPVLHGTPPCGGDAVTESVPAGGRGATC